MTSLLLATGRLEPPVSPRGEPVAMTLLTGFLGAGKTTLLNRILNGDHGLEVGVLVNDFGAVNIDAELVASVTENTIALTNGCVCCEVRDDLVESLEALLEQRPEIDYLIVEASGVADPEGVVMTLSDPKYEELLRIDSVTCVVDAEGLFTQGSSAELATLKLRQIAFSDLVVLNKVDLVDVDQIEVIKGWIGQHLTRVRIVESEYCEVPYSILLAAGRFDPNPPQDGSMMIEPGEPRFDTWHYRSELHMSEPRLQEAIRKLPESVYRCKGIVWTRENTTRRTALQSVGRRTSFSDLGSWNGETPATDIVVIGADGGLIAHDLQRSFDSCVAS